MAFLSATLERLSASPTVAMANRAAALRAEGADLIALAAGEPDFDTPEHIKEAAIRGLRDGHTKYTPVGGTPALKKAIIAKHAEDNALEYKPSQIIASVGGKQACYNVCQALLDAGDEVLIPAPYWVSYPDMALLADGTPRIIETTAEQRFKMTPESLEAAITPASRLLFLNSPSNPSGMAYSKEELAALGEVLRRHPRIVIASDDMYEKILWGDAPFANIINACPDLYERTVVIHAVSKTYSMTGWRLGWSAGPEWLITAMANIQSQSTSNPTSIAQDAAIAALERDEARVRVEGEVRRAWMSWEQAERDVALARDEASLAGQNVEITEAAFAAGGASALDVDAVREQRRLAEIALAEAEVARDASLHVLRVVTGAVE